MRNSRNLGAAIKLIKHSIMNPVNVYGPGGLQDEISPFIGPKQYIKI
jgi:hypothetical protein